jgi:hypothetical protein
MVSSTAAVQQMPACLLDCWQSPGVAAATKLKQRSDLGFWSVEAIPLQLVGALLLHLLC